MGRREREFSSVLVCLTSALGFEFIFFSFFRLNAPSIPPSGPAPVPCFLPWQAADAVIPGARRAGFRTIFRHESRENPVLTLDLVYSMTCEKQFIPHDDMGLYCSDKYVQIRFSSVDLRIPHSPPPRNPSPVNPLLLLIISLQLPQN